MRREKGLSQEELALRAGISRSYMYEIERAGFSASLDKVEKIAKVLAVDPWELLAKPPKSGKGTRQ